MRSRADSPTKTCAEAGCGNALRARGLCSTHYNQQQPGRHKPTAAACSVCGAECSKGRTRERVVCSFACRWFLQNEQHSSPVSFPACEWCDATFATRLPGARWCSDACRFTAQRTEWPTCQVYYASCSWCEAPFTTWHPGQRWCTPRCAGRGGRAARRALERGAAGTFTWAEVIGLFIRFGRCCAYCRRQVDGQPDPDHVVPLSRGGSNSITNILPACRRCNGDKRDLSLDEWTADRRRRNLPAVVTTWAVGDPKYLHLAISRSVTQGDLAA